MRGFPANDEPSDTSTRTSRPAEPRFVGAIWEHGRWPAASPVRQRTFHGEVHQPAAWTPVSLVPQPDGSIIPFRISLTQEARLYVSTRPPLRQRGDILSRVVPALIEACHGDQQAEAWRSATVTQSAASVSARCPAPISVRLPDRATSSEPILCRACRGLRTMRRLERTIGEFNGPAQLARTPSSNAAPTPTSASAAHPATAQSVRCPT